MHECINSHIVPNAISNQKPEPEFDIPSVTKEEIKVAHNSAPNLTRRAAAEFFAMAMFVWVGTGTAVSANHAQYNGETEVAFSSTSYRYGLWIWYHSSCRKFGSV